MPKASYYSYMEFLQKSNNVFPEESQTYLKEDKLNSTDQINLLN